MILYTTMPQELIFQDSNDSFTKQTILEHNGLSLVVEPVSTNQCRIVQVLSTNPYDFLNEAYTPGAIITLAPSIN